MCYYGFSGIHEFRNTYGKTIGELDKANGITGMFGKKVLIFAANNLDSLIKVTGAFVAAGAVAYIGRYANGMLVSAYNTAKNTREHYSSVKATYDNIRAKRLEMQTMQAVLAEQYGRSAKRTYTICLA